MHMSEEERFLVTDLLVFAKNGVRTGSLVITETTTPFVREALLRQLNQGVHLHAKVFHYMQRRGLYPSHHVEQVIQGNIRDANIALQMPAGM